MGGKKRGETAEGEGVGVNPDLLGGEEAIAMPEDRGGNQPAEEGALEKKARAASIQLLRDGVVLMEEIANEKAPSKDKAHPLNENRDTFLNGLRVALRVLGHEHDANEKPVTDEEVDRAVNVASVTLGLVRGGAYQAWAGRVKAWLTRAGR